jgi:predicted transcriptional regulator
MRCPACGHETLEGDDACSNCGASLWPSDTPQPATTFRGPMLGEHLDQLGVGPPVLADSTERIDVVLRRMRSAGTDCVLATFDGRLVGVFTERDAVVKLAGLRHEAFAMRDLMTRDPVVLRTDDTLAVAIHKMAVGGFRHIPVVDAVGVPLGVLAARDVFRHVLSIAG